MKNKTINLPMVQIIIDYQNGMSMRELGEKYNCGSTTINRKLKQFGVKIRPRGGVQITNLPIDQIIYEYQNGMNLSKLAEKYNCSLPTISDRLKQFGIKILSRGEAKYFDLPIEQIIIDYKSGINAYELGEKYNCARCTIINRLKQFGVKIRSNSESHILDLPIEQIIIDYQNGMNLYELGKKYDCGHATIRDKLKQSGIKNRTVKEASNMILIHICIKCGHTYKGRPKSMYCPSCLSNKYCYKFNEECREQNREKYNRECFFCGKTEEENERKLSSHHADYNKNQGCDKTPDWKLVPLCISCHSMTGGNKENRVVWEARILYLHKEYWS